MKRHIRPPDEHRQQTIEAVALFSVLMHARDSGELQEAADAQQELARLGVAVRFRRPTVRRKGGQHA